MEQVIYKSEAYQIIGVCMEVYNILGYGFAEVVYKDAMEIEFVERSMQHKREHLHVIKYKGKILQHNFLQILHCMKVSSWKSRQAKKESQMMPFLKHSIT